MPPVRPPPPLHRPSKPLYAVVTGNPNCGKTTVFNALTGLRAKVGNYAGVTVERKEGRLQHAPPDLTVRVLDLPGSYSLSPQSLDEQVARDVLLQRVPEIPPPAVVVVVLDASNLQRNLYYATQVIELGYPTLIALNMLDVAESLGHQLDAAALSRELGVPVVPLVASSGQGIAELRQHIVAALRSPPTDPPQNFCELPPAFAAEAARLADHLAETSPESPHSGAGFQPVSADRLEACPTISAPAASQERPTLAAAKALLLLSSDQPASSSHDPYPAALQQAITAARQRLTAAGVDWRSAAIAGRYQRAAAIEQAVLTQTGPGGETPSDRIDRVLTHKIWGTLIFFAVMALMFQSIFTFARIPMDLLQSIVDGFGAAVSRAIPPGDLNSLLTDGVIAGVGAVIVFLPQILLLFLFIGFLEDTGYMARAAFLMDRLMSKVGLHGKSFIPMLSSFACAIPGIMATRTIEGPRDRIVTILVAPLMSCSARLPVYTLLIAACIPQRHVLGFLHLPGLTLLGMYLLGIVVALFMAWLFKRTLLKGVTPMLILELPPYKRPLFRQVLRHVWDRSKLFLRRAGTVILGINILLWFLATYPRSAEVQKEFAYKRAAVFTAARTAGLNPKDSRFATHLKSLDRQEAGARVRHSFAGGLGRAIEPFIAPLGFDWQIGIGIVTSFAAREVFVSTLSTVYNVGDDSSGTSLVQTLHEQRRPDGQPVYTTLTGLTLMVFYVFALQCVSTVAVVRRETNSWKWPLFQWFYMGVLAWGLAFATRQVGLLLGMN
jgi:ferrous iron transport protein B